MAEISRDCLDIDAELSALIDGELGGQPLARVEAHLARCERCRARLAELRAADVALAALPASAVPGDLAARLARRIEAEAPGRIAAPRDAPRRARRVAAWLALPAAAAAALALYLGLRPAASPEGPQVAREPLPAPAAAPVPVAPAAPEAHLAAAPKAPGPAPARAGDAEGELDALGTEDLAVVLDLDTMQDLPVIANLDALEHLLDEGGAG